jgi:hypothetical protein
MRTRTVSIPLRRPAPHLIQTVKTLTHEVEDTTTGYTIKIWRTDDYMSNRQVVTSWTTKIHGAEYGEIWYPITQSSTPDLVREPNDLELETYYKHPA